MTLNTLRDYDDMTSLMKSDEWSTWVTFQTDRRVGLVTKVLAYVRDGNLAEAQKCVAVMDDIKKQIELFRTKKKDLEKDLELKEE